MASTKNEQGQVTELGLGTHRPVYLWAGPGTSRMNRLKFMGRKVDDAVHHIAHTEAGAERISAMGFNWVYLTCNWGFPPEIEQEDWDSFRQAVQVYHAKNIKVFGYIQTSNCVYKGSYKHKDWYAIDPFGKKIPYYTGRYFTCLNHPDWLAEVRDRVRIVVEAGADGVFFDNPWVGGGGVEWKSAIWGVIGSYSEYSRRAYAEDNDGAEIPTVLYVGSPESQQYLRWRANLMTRVIREWADYARELNPAIKISANNLDAINRNAFVELGMELPALAELQDIVMIENFALPRLLKHGGVASNAIVLGAAKAHTNHVPVSTISYEQGIGFEHVWSGCTFARTLLEGTAMNCPVVTKGTEYLHQKHFTLLIHDRYAHQQNDIRQVNRWLTENAAWLSQREPSSELAIYHPYQATRFQWEATWPAFFAACETLFHAGLPFRIVGDNGWPHVKTLIVPPGDVDRLDENLRAFQDQGGKIVALDQPRLGQGIWQNFSKQGSLPQWRTLRREIVRFASIGWRTYHHIRLIRALADSLGLPRYLLAQEHMYALPPESLRRELLDTIGTWQPHVEAEQPLLFTMWREPSGESQYHLVNYSDQPQRITLHLPRLVKAQVYTPESTMVPTPVAGTSFQFELKVAKVIRTQK